MASLSSAMKSYSNISSHFDEEQWIIQIRQALDEDLEEKTQEIPVSIFHVPRTLKASKPDCYIPQEVAFGPYHYWRPELYEMQRYKLAAAQRIQKQLKNLRFHQLVEELVKYGPKTRAYYHTYLDFNGETLAWMMAVDASFLLEFLQIFAIKEGNKKLLTSVSSRMSHLLDIAGAKSAHNAILRDMVMLENQIPSFLLRKMLEVQFSSVELADNMLVSMLIGFRRELSPFKMKDEEHPHIRVWEHVHLLGVLYSSIVPESEVPSEITEVEEEREKEGEGKDEESNILGEANYIKQCVDEVWKLIMKLGHVKIRFIKRLVFSKPIQVILKLPWKIISNLPGFKVFKLASECLCFPQDKENVKPVNDSSSLNSTGKPPLVEEISIPSVTELSKAGVKFSPTNGGILNLGFDCKTVTLYLPTINIDVNTEVILRNLVAYEACNASGPLALTRYTELMNGIIDTAEDAKLLRQRGIIVNRLKNDEEVANLWNGMSRSMRLTKVPFLDKVIEDVNKYHGSKLTVKAGKFMKAYVFQSWKFLSLFAAILLLLLVTFQAFCSVYSCSRITHEHLQ
ncbi:unnamed protein product [Ilex paraguariensis]|uniref:Uncharacterized protein n=1 Tax=Ilex paraguariensis TaxID=185542 RepID=A0ABC8TSA3_9AQUA